MSSGRFSVVLCGWLLSGAACYESAGSDDDAAPAASSIPTAAHSAIGADYPPPGGAAAVVGSGIAECDAYFRKVEGCKGLPPSTLQSLKDAAKAMRQSIKQASSPEAKEAIRQSCEAATKALSACDTKL